MSESQLLTQFLANLKELKALLTAAHWLQFDALKRECEAALGNVFEEVRSPTNTHTHTQAHTHTHKHTHTPKHTLFADTLSFCHRLAYPKVIGAGNWMRKIVPRSSTLATVRKESLRRMLEILSMSCEFHLKEVRTNTRARRHTHTHTHMQTHSCKHTCKHTHSFHFES